MRREYRSVNFSLFRWSREIGGPLQSCVFTSEAIHNVTGCCDDKTQSNDGIAIFYCRRQQPNYDQFNCARRVFLSKRSAAARKRQTALIRPAEAADRFTLLQEIQPCVRSTSHRSSAEPGRFVFARLTLLSSIIFHLSIDVWVSAYLPRVFDTLHTLRQFLYSNWWEFFPVVSLRGVPNTKETPFCFGEH